MKRELILVRHTKSSWKDIGLRDFDRPLKKDRIDDAKQMGKKLKQLGLQPAHVICSPALRTRQTAEYLLDKLKFDLGKVAYEKSIYESSAEDIMQAVRETDADITSLMVIGHNPSLTHFVNLFMPAPVMELPTTGVVWLQLECSSWEIYSTTPCKLIQYLTPAQLD